MIVAGLHVTVRFLYSRYQTGSVITGLQQTMESFVSVSVAMRDQYSYSPKKIIKFILRINKAALKRVKSGPQEINALQKSYPPPK